MFIREMKEKPRERLLEYGVGSLSDSELLAIIIGKGTRKEGVISLANKLLREHNLETISKMSTQELINIQGIGLAKASQIRASFEINKRLRQEQQQKNTITNAQDVYEQCKETIGQQDKEHFMILHLDTKNKVLKEEIIAIGTLNGALIHPREVFRSAIKEGANSIILVHNHPSGDPTPSQEDKEVTKLLQKAGKILNIKVLDHVIIGNKKWFSFESNN